MPTEEDHNMYNRSIDVSWRQAKGAMCGLLCLWASVAEADVNFCNSYSPGGINAGVTFAAGFYFCADATARGDTVGTYSDVDSVGPFPQGAEIFGSGTGVFSVARSSASGGTLRAYASGHADAAGMEDPNRSANGIAHAFFYDSGTLTSSTLPMGTSVTVETVATITGGFAGTGASGQGYFVIYRNGFFAPGTTGPIPFALGPGFGAVSFPLTLGFNVGDTVGIFMTIEANASAVNRPSTPSGYEAIADMESTGKFFLDVATPGVDFNAASGHIYAAVPEPSIFVLWSAGIALLAVSTFRRRRSKACLLG
jgi:hypothetical protein